MVYTRDDDACESSRQFVESHSYPPYMSSSISRSRSYATASAT